MKQVVKWAGGLVAAGLVLLLVSFFVADRQLAPPFEEAELGPVTVPVGAPLPAGVVLFAGDETGTLEIYLRSSDGAVMALTNDPGFDSWRPRISPNRQTVLFNRNTAAIVEGEVPQVSLWMIGAQGGEPIEVLPVGAHGWTSQGGADWSPSGDELVMVGGRPQGAQIWVTSVDGRDVRNLTNTPGDNLDPSWSPDGKRILFTACAQAPCLDTEREVFALPVSGGERIQITNDDLRDEQPRFSPDGRQIVMRSQIVAADEEGVGAIWDIRVVPTNRSQPPRRLVGDASISSSPMWVDGQTVIFDRSESDEPSDIVTARVSDGLITEVVTGPANELQPAP